MGGFGYYLISAVFLVVFLGVSWVVTGLLHLSGATEMIVRTLLIRFGQLVSKLWKS